MKIVVKKVKGLMNSKLLTQAQLACMANVSRATVNSALLKGTCNAGTVGKIAKALEVDPSEIIEQEA